ncbi:MAG: competence protein CoiA family protein [Candidatus Udaeobacter sp.]
MSPESNESDAEVIHDAYDVGCFGLVAGWAYSLKTLSRHYAPNALRSNGPFICESCYSDAVLRKCAEKRDHFAHHTPLSPIILKRETQLHADCLAEICSALKARFPSGKWDVNRTIPANKSKGIGQVVPDISGRVRDQRVAIEAQVSHLTIPRIIRRSRVYHQRDIPILWIVPLTEPIGDRLFRPRLVERYFHSIYFGRAYYWLPGSGTTLQPIHFGPARRFIDHSEWHDPETGEDREAGGYFRRYRVIKRPFYGKSVDVAEHFYRRRRAAFTPPNERKEVPESVIWLDKQPIWWDEKKEKQDDDGAGSSV